MFSFYLLVHLTFSIVFLHLHFTFTYVTYIKKTFTFFFLSSQQRTVVSLTHFIRAHLQLTDIFQHKNTGLQAYY